MTNDAKVAGFDFFNQIFNEVFADRWIDLNDDVQDFTFWFSSWLWLVLSKSQGCELLDLTDQLTFNRLEIKRFGKFSANKVIVSPDMWDVAQSCSLQFVSFNQWQKILCSIFPFLSALTVTALAASFSISKKTHHTADLEAAPHCNILRMHLFFMDFKRVFQALDLPIVIFDDPLRWKLV